MAQLKTRLKELRRETADFRWFVPQKLLQQLMTRGVVEDILRGNVKPYHLEEISERVICSGIKILAVLVLIDCTSCIASFVEKDQLHDLRIPFERKILQTMLQEPGAADFAERQWEFTAPEYFRGTLTRNLDERVVLPFAKDTKIDEGGFGTVFEIEIHEEHQDLEKCFRQKLVRKQIDDSKTYRVELENLSILGSLRHPNILELLTSYTHRGLHNLVFPLAQDGNLAQLLYGETANTAYFSPATAFVALAGLGAAIESLHTFVNEKIDLHLIGFHHDLRPKNIFVQGPNLILADFGLSRIKDISQHSDTPFREGTGDYVAPECEDIVHNYETSRIRRSSDIWSFGCILAEMATYIAHGSKGVVDFRLHRRFSVPHPHGRGSRIFYLFHCGPYKRNEAVISQLDSLEALGSNALTALIKLVRRMLVMDETQRSNASEVASQLRVIVLKMFTDDLLQRFCEMQRQNSFTDVIVEHERFKGWTRGAGLASYQQLDSPVCIVTMPVFSGMLDVLSQMRNQLKTLPPSITSSDRSAIVPISRLNDSLMDLLSQEQQDVSTTYFKASMINRNGLPPDVFTDKDTHGSIKLRFVLSHMEQLMNDDSSRDLNEQQLDGDDVRVPKVFGDHNIGTWTHDDVTRHVLVEWRRHESDVVEEAVSTELFEQLKTLVHYLSLEKPPEFRALDCRGIYHSPSHFAFGVVFELPHAFVQSLNLKELISRTQSMAEQPLLETRYKLASILAQSVLEFHLVGWLHKRLKPSNIAFFPKHGQSIDMFMQDVYVIGFNHSRLDEPNAFTSGFRDADGKCYQHPVYLSGTDRFRPEFDYYSLGLLLLEIGLWTPITTLVKRHLDGPAEKLRAAAVSRVSLLGPATGCVYRDAVDACIKGLFKTSGDSALDDGPSMGKHFGFEEAVVAPLKRLSHGFGG